MYNILELTFEDECAMLPRLLHDERVFTIGKRVDGSYGITECCDDYFSEKLTRDQILQLAQELIDYVGKEQ